MSWSAEQYTMFEDERNRPIRDLLAAIPTRAVRSAIDIGCGPGNSTELLQARFPDAAVRGMDSSDAMIAAARTRMPQARFETSDITDWSRSPDGPFDVILGNAVLQWLPDHAGLFPRLAGKLAPGGSLAVQMPDNLDEPVQALMREVAAAGPWAGTLAGIGGMRTPMGSMDWFYGLLRPHCARVDVWRTTFNHPLAGVDAIVEWFKGSGLRPFLAGLDADERADYLARYREALSRVIPAQANGEVLLPFPRLFVVATR